MDLITTPVAFGQSPPENSILHSTSVSFTGRSPSEPVHIVQYDLTVPVIAISLTANGQPYTVPSGAAVNIRLAKPDGHYVYDPAYGVSDDGQTVYIAVTGQMTVAAGKTQPVIEVVVDSGTAATGSFTLVIDENPVPDSALQSSDEYLTMQQILAEVQAAAQLVEENQENLQNLTDNLEAVQNAGANAQVAAASAAAAQQSAEEAAQSAQQALGFRTFFGAITPDANGDIDPSRPMATSSAQTSWTIESKGDRIQSVQVNGYAGQGGTSIPVTLTGHETVTKNLLLTDPLLSGDNVQSCVQSGCDVALTLNGGPSETWVQNGANGAYQLSSQTFPATESNSVLANMLSSYLAVKSASGVYGGSVGISINTSGKLSLKLPGGTSPTEYLPGHPLDVWYRSADYTEQADILVELETHANGNVYAHPAVYLVAVPYTQADVDAANQLAGTPSTLPAIDSPDVPMLLDETVVSEPDVVVQPDGTLDSENTQKAADWIMNTATQVMALAANAVPVAGTYVVSSQEGATVAVSLKPFQDGGDAATVGGYTAQELIAGSGDVDAETLNGQSAQQILQSAESTAQGYTQSYTQSYVQQQMQNVYTKTQTRQIVSFLYKATFDVDEWTSSAGGYTQTVEVTPVDGGPAITSQSVMTSAVTVDDTVQGSAGEELDAAAAIVNGGAKTFGSGTITCVIQGAAPTADAEVFFNASGGGS